MYSVRQCQKMDTVITQERCAFMKRSLLIQEILPSLLQVVNQPLRPVAQHLFTPQEKKMLTLVVATLVAYALTFDLGQQQPCGLPDGAGASACGLTPLTPAVHTLCSFPVGFKQAYGASRTIFADIYNREYCCWSVCLFVKPSDE